MCFSQIISNEMSKHWQFNGSFLTVPVFLQRSLCQIPAIGVFHIQLVGRQGNWPRQWVNQLSMSTIGYQCISVKTTITYIYIIVYICICGSSWTTWFKLIWTCIKCTTSHHAHLWIFRKERLAPSAPKQPWQALYRDTEGLNVVNTRVFPDKRSETVTLWRPFVHSTEKYSP